MKKYKEMAPGKGLLEWTELQGALLTATLDKTSPETGVAVFLSLVIYQLVNVIISLISLVLLLLQLAFSEVISETFSTQHSESVYFILHGDHIIK